MFKDFLFRWKLELEWYGIKVKWSFQNFEPRDLWIGVYWKRESFSDIMNGTNWTAYVCVVPMLPIIISWRTYD